MALLSGDLLTAEGILLQNGLTEEAVRINIEIYNWNRYNWNRFFKFIKQFFKNIAIFNVLIIDLEH